MIRDYYKQLYTNKMDNQEEMNKFLERYKLPKQNKEEIENMNRPITSAKVEIVIWKLPANKSPGLAGFIGKFYQTFRKQLTLSFWNYFKKLEKR